jgi:hypothetical protein
MGETHPKPDMMSEQDNLTKGIERKIWKNPNKFFSHADPTYENNVVWLCLEPKRMDKQPAIARMSPSETKTNVTFQFLLPNELIENVQHHWEDYECLAGRAAQFYGELNKNWNDASSLGTAAKKWADSMLEGGKSREEASLTNEVRNAVMSSQVFNYRVDSALHYKTSERRRYEITLQLVETGDPKSDIMEIVRAIQKFSSPTMQKGTLADIRPPYIFRVYTMPKGWIDIDYAVLNAVQPTFKGPYIDGYPSTCDLLLSITDMSPLYDELFSFKDKVTTKSVGGQSGRS